MKKFMLATLSVIVIAGCVKDIVYEDQPVPILFDAGISAVNTRAPIVSSGAVSYTHLTLPTIYSL